MPRRVARDTPMSDPALCQKVSARGPKGPASGLPRRSWAAAALADVRRYCVRGPLIWECRRVILESSSDAATAASLSSSVSSSGTSLSYL